MRYLALVAAGLALGGCATVTRGTTNQIQIVSEPSGANVLTSLNQTCVTPCTLTVSRKDEFSITFSKPGYESQVIAVRTQLAGSGAAGLAGNVILGGVVGMGVDVATGSTLEHVPNPVSAALRPAAGPRHSRPYRPTHRAPAPRAANETPES